MRWPQLTHADVEGQRYGRLVLRAVYPLRSPARAVQVTAKCDCGRFTIVALSRLRDGAVKSCGCLKREPRAVLLRGRRFDRWTVIKPYDGYARVRKGSTEQPSPMALCRCDCGTVKRVRLCSLRSGYSRSCGCLVADVQRARPRDQKGRFAA